MSIFDVLVILTAEIASTEGTCNASTGCLRFRLALGATGARITGTAALELHLRKSKRALATMCVGVGQGVAIALEAV